MMCGNERERNLYWTVSDTRRVANDLWQGADVFVPTRLTLRLGEPVRLRVRDRRGDELEIPAVVLGRRTRAGAGGTLSPGLVVRRRHAGADDAAGAEDLTVVPARATVIPLSPLPVVTLVCTDLRSMDSNIESLDAGQAIFAESSCPLPVGSMARLVLDGPRGARHQALVTVRTSTLHDGTFGAWFVRPAALDHPADFLTPLPSLRRA